MASPGERIEGWFPRLKAEGYSITSDPTATYNCIAWALGRTDAWWEPSENPRYYWPHNASQDDRVSSLVEVFQLTGFQECTDALLEEGYEKVAIYGEDDTFLHAARQQPDGKWTSKLGAYEDIEHPTLEALAGSEYGSVVRVLRRSLASPNSST